MHISIRSLLDCYTVAMNQLLGSGLPAKVYESLSIGDGKQCWNVYADVVVLDYDGALLDCCSMGVYPHTLFFLLSSSLLHVNDATLLAMNAYFFWYIARALDFMCMRVFSTANECCS
jgi:hypothetical protein